MAASQPNIVFIIADDLGVHDTGITGNKDVRTPNIDRLAERGCLFENVFVASPTCAPSRGALLSGLMPARNGAEPNHTWVRDGVKQLPHYMKALGYEVAAFGKVTHGNNDPRAGFEYKARKSLSGAAVSAYLAERNSEKPLCLFLGIEDPHVPWPEKPSDHYAPSAFELPPNFIEHAATRHAMARYYSDIDAMDALLGELLDVIDEELGEDALLLFTSDHGAQMPYAKWNLYDVGIRVPLIAVWKGRLAAGSKNSAMISFVDFLPTFVELGGGTPPAKGFNPGEIDGQSFAGLLRGTANAHREHVWATNSSAEHHTYPIRALRTSRFKYILNPYSEFDFTTQIDHNPKSDTHAMWAGWFDVAQEDTASAAKLEAYHRRPKEELYDLAEDPFELKNLAADAAHLKRLKRFRGMMENWLEASVDKLKIYGEPKTVLLEPLIPEE